MFHVKQRGAAHRWQSPSPCVLLPADGNASIAGMIAIAQTANRLPTRLPIGLPIERSRADRRSVPSAAPSLADAEAAEDLVEDVLHIDRSGQPTDRLGGTAQILRAQFDLLDRC
jgi:hypothetical protein